MVVDLKFSRFCDEPWGFRLTGGTDFEFPLTVIKVSENSLAEQAGMKFGDIIVRINDTPASNLSHLEAHNVLLAAGNNFMIGVKRDNEPEEPTAVEDYSNTGYASEGEEEVREILYFAESMKQKDQSPEELEEEQIAELLSSEAEVLKEHNIMGVNFNKIIPKATAIKGSAVLQELNEQAVKTAADKKKDAQKWTTFLQKPDRPIPKTKEELARERLPIYKVKIVKQPKPRGAPGREPTPPVVEEVMEPEPEVIAHEEEVENIVEENVVETCPVQEEEIIDQPVELLDNEVPDLVAEEPEPLAGIPSELEKQLADVQKQLLALSNLPQAIQATLDAVTSELAKIVPVIQEVASKQASVDRDYRSKSLSRDIEPPIVETEMTVIEETVEERYELEDQPKEEGIVGDHEISSCSSETSHDDGCSMSSVGTPAVTVTKEHPLEDHQKELKQAIENRKNHEMLEDTRERQRSKLVPGKLSEKATSAFGPLVPQERPIYLPGGRRWKTPKDAFNDDFIREVISSQAELIVGSTLGVNFLKYKKPEKKVDLANSEVFRYLTNMEKNPPPQRGIEARPERVYTEADVRRSSAHGE